MFFPDEVDGEGSGIITGGGGGFDYSDPGSGEDRNVSSVPFFASRNSTATTTIATAGGAERAKKPSEPAGMDPPVVVSRRGAFRYGTVLAGATWITGLALTQTNKLPDPPPTPRRPSLIPEPILRPVVAGSSISSSEEETPRRPQEQQEQPSKTTATIPGTSSSSSAAKQPLPSKTTAADPADAGRLEPVNLAKVASETNINVTMNCEKMCVSIDSSNFTFNKVEKAKAPGWLPSFLAPKSQVVKKIPNSELLVAATAAGSVTEMARTLLLYPLQTVKTRLQADRNERRADSAASGSSPSSVLSAQLANLGSNIRRKVDDGRLYAGISPTLLVSVPATGIYYGVRDVTKRMLYMTPLDATWVAIGGALVGDVVSLCFRTPSEALAIRLQAQNETTGDWLEDSFRRLPMVILTDLPYLLSKIALNRLLIRGSLSVSDYASYAVLASVVAGFLTTPFDVARTRILLDKELVAGGIGDDDDNDDDEPLLLLSERTTTTPDTIANTRPGHGVLRTMIQITKEGDGGIGNLFSGWLERVVYLGIGRAWLEPIQLIGYIGIRDAVLLEWF